LLLKQPTIINAEDYGHTVYDLSIRRALIQVGEDMVNVAYDAPVDFSPRNQIEDAERRLYELAETGRYDGGFQRFAQALTTRSIWPRTPSSATESYRASPQDWTISIA
jgi:replicative DNA helicase